MGYNRSKFESVLLFVNMVVILLLLVTVIFGLYTIYESIVSHNSIEDISNDEYISPSSILPTNYDEVYKSILESKNRPNTIELIEKDNVITAINTKNKDEIVLYIKYSKLYDCTTVSKSIDDKYPLLILHHFEYNNVDEYLKELLVFIDNYPEVSEINVNIATEDGEMKVNLN